jgi:predicted nucleotidyltransferase component of viral defense system
MALSKIQLAVLEALAQSPLRNRFYWTGGTLLAEKYLHHRHSYDVDVFTDTPFRYEEVLPLVQEVKKRVKLKRVEERKVSDRWEFFLHNHQEVRFEFVHYQFPHLKPRKTWQGVLVDSLEDLAANKTMALVERHAPKDAVDIYFLMTKKKFTPKRLLALAGKKFGLQMHEDTFLSEALRAAKQLPEIRPMLHGTSRQQEHTLKEIQSYFDHMAYEFLRQRLKEDDE